MVYIRAKKVKSDQYLYLVKSVWDSKRNTSKQEIVKYLGKASDVDKEDIPIDYRDDPKVLSVLSKFNPIYQRFYGFQEVFCILAISQVGCLAPSWQPTIHQVKLWPEQSILAQAVHALCQP